MRALVFTTKTHRHSGFLRKKGIMPMTSFALMSLCLCAFVVQLFAQEKPPAPAAPKSVNIPPVIESKLPNGMTVAVVGRKNVPLVTIQMLIRSGGKDEAADKAGLANLTVDMLTKGTRTRTATQIAEAVEFLGGSIRTGAGWNNSSVSITVTADKLDKALAIMADVFLAPKFDQKELDLLRSQTIDELNGDLKQPGFIAGYVASRYSFGEHPVGGTPESITRLSRNDVISFYRGHFTPDNAILIFTGDVSAPRATRSAKKQFGTWKRGTSMRRLPAITPSSTSSQTPEVGRILVVDLPKSGQAAVSYLHRAQGLGRNSREYYPAVAANSVLSGYSGRLNSEIRIKRGLSYGAASSIAWRLAENNFSTRVQTKNETAAEVAELTLAEIKRLAKESVGPKELGPRKSVLTGSFGRTLETTEGLANALAELYAFGLPTGELNNYMSAVNSVTGKDIMSFAGQNLLGGDIVIVGDYSLFKDDLAKRFPKVSVRVVEADKLDLSHESLQK